MTTITHVPEAPSLVLVRKRMYPSYFSAMLRVTQSPKPLAGSVLVEKNGSNN